MNTEMLAAELLRDEDERLTVYPDSEGVPTIGVGRNLRDVGISREESRFLLANDIARTAADLDRELPWWRGLDEVRQHVLMNMAFNLGADSSIPGRDRLLKFTTTLRLIAQGNYPEAAKAMLRSKWARQVGVRAGRLAEQMRTGMEA